MAQSVSAALSWLWLHPEVKQPTIVRWPSRKHPRSVLPEPDDRTLEGMLSSLSRKAALARRGTCRSLSHGGN